MSRLQLLAGTVPTVLGSLPVIIAPNRVAEDSEQVRDRYCGDPTEPELEPHTPSMTIFTLVVVFHLLSQSFMSKK